jgi:molecular chaperone DnaJ
VKVRVPAGVDDGQRIRVKERGAAGTNGGPPGDLYVVVHVRPDATFGRKGNDLTVHVPISYPQAVLGSQIRVPTLAGDGVTIKIPAGTPSGKTLRVPKRGIEGGALLVTVDIEVPAKLDDAQRAAVEALAASLDGTATSSSDAQTKAQTKAQSNAQSNASTNGAAQEESEPQDAPPRRRRKSDGAS